MKSIRILIATLPPLIKAYEQLLQVINSKDKDVDKILQELEKYPKVNLPEVNRLKRSFIYQPIIKKNW